VAKLDRRTRKISKGRGIPRQLVRLALAAGIERHELSNEADLITRLREMGECVAEVLGVARYHTRRAERVTPRC
jgi:hypothetical protein